MKILSSIGDIASVVAIMCLIIIAMQEKSENNSLRAKIRQYEVRDSINALNVDTIVFVGHANSFTSIIGRDSIRIQAFTWARKPR